jgi:peptidoglycan-associated lipoprotein
MRTFLITVVLLLAVSFLAIMAPAAAAQSITGLEIAANYTYVHSNAPPGGCGCFSFNGGGGSAAWHFNSNFAVVGDFAVVHANNYDASGFSPTITLYLFGPRFTYPIAEGRFIPFAQVLAGGAHASGGYFPSGIASSTSANAFALTAGGGLDIAIVKHISLRAAQVEYFYTGFPNGVNGRQNNLRVSAGLVFHF